MQSSISKWRVSFVGESCMPKGDGKVRSNFGAITPSIRSFFPLLTPKVTLSLSLFRSSVLTWFPSHFMVCWVFAAIFWPMLWWGIWPIGFFRDLHSFLCEASMISSGKCDHTGTRLIGETDSISALCLFPPQLPTYWLPKDLQTPMWVPSSPTILLSSGSQSCGNLYHDVSHNPI